MLIFDPGKMPFHWYEVNNYSSGNIGNFNYRILPQKDHLEVSWWMGVYSYERTQQKTDVSFDFTPAGLEQAWEWLQQQFFSCDPEEIQRPLNILDQEPYFPAPQQEEPTADEPAPQPQQPEVPEEPDEPDEPEEPEEDEPPFDIGPSGVEEAPF